MKKVLSYLAAVAPSKHTQADNGPGIEDKILQSNPLLEALGNAKTLRNSKSVSVDYATTDGHCERQTTLVALENG